MKRYQCYHPSKWCMFIAHHKPHTNSFKAAFVQILVIIQKYTPCPILPMSSIVIFCSPCLTRQTHLFKTKKFIFSPQVTQLPTLPCPLKNNRPLSQAYPCQTSKSRLDYTSFLIIFYTELYLAHQFQWGNWALHKIVPHTVTSHQGTWGTTAKTEQFA